MIPFEAIIPIVIAQALLGLAVMIDIHKHQSCRWCDHCRRTERDKEERQLREKHAKYHQFHHVPLSNCHDPDCPGR